MLQPASNMPACYCLQVLLVRLVRGFRLQLEDPDLLTKARL